MQKKQKSKVVSWILCMMLIVAMALCTAGCNKKDTPSDGTAGVTAPADASGQKEDGQKDDSQTTNPAAGDVTELGEGKAAFSFLVVDKDGNEAKFLIHTDKETVGAALLELALIEGDEGEYGLYVKKVNGITADYDVDQTYWAFYINGEYAMTGVDATAVTDGAEYSFKVEK